jgi:hypothetical protein
LKSTEYYEKIKAVFDNPNIDFKSQSVINLFYNIDEDNIKDFEKTLTLFKKEFRCIVFAVRAFLLHSDANYFLIS